MAISPEEVARRFRNLTDIVSLVKTGNALKSIRVNAGETAYELAAVEGSGGGDALTSDPLNQFAQTTAAQLDGVVSDANLVLSGVGAPSAGVGNVNSLYIDMSNPLNPQLYWKT